MTRKNTTEKPTMTRKEALAVMHKIQDAVGGYLYHPDASEEWKILRSQVYDALSILDQMVWREQIGYRQLCGFCYLRIVEDGNLLVTRKPNYHTGFCCYACLTQLKAEEGVTLAVEKFGNYDGEWKYIPLIEDEQPSGVTREGVQVS